MFTCQIMIVIYKIFFFFIFFPKGKNEDDSLRQEEIILRIRNTLDKEKGLFVRQVERQINELTHQVINEIRDTNPLNGKNLHFFDDKTKKEAL